MAEDVKKEVEIEVQENKKEEKKPTKEEKKEKKDKFDKKLEEKENQIQSLNEQLEAFKDKYYRAIADMDNQRKQYEKEYRNALRYSAQDLAEKLIPSFEMFSMVIETADKLPPEVSAYVQGFNMIYRQMVQALESEGVTEIITKVGDDFDHTVHAAMETEEVSDETMVNKIVKVIRKGYKIHDRLIKPTAVIVGKAKQEEKVEDTQEEANA